MLFVVVEVFGVDDVVVVSARVVEVFPRGETAVAAPEFVLVALAPELTGSVVVSAALVGPRGSVTNLCVVSGDGGVAVVAKGWVKFPPSVWVGGLTESRGS